MEKCKPNFYNGFIDLNIGTATSIGYSQILTEHNFPIECQLHSEKETKFFFMLKAQPISVANTQSKVKNGVDRKLRERRWQLKTYK